MSSNFSCIPTHGDGDLSDVEAVLGGTVILASKSVFVIGATLRFSIEMTAINVNLREREHY